MQDRYAGDVGDFGKFGLLRQMASAGLKIGINWYYNDRPEENINDDGKHIGYLNNKAFQNCDDELIDVLRNIVGGNRSVAALEEADLIPNARYYSAALKPGNSPDFSRDAWHRNSMEAFADSDIIFCDPDNGLLVKSVSPTCAKSVKYATENELAAYYSSGKSVMLYNHRCRQKERIYLQRFASLRMLDELASAK